MTGSRCRTTRARSLRLRVMAHGRLSLSAALLALSLITAATAQTYPSQPIKLIVPFAAGGPLDLVGRGLGDKLSASLKQPIIIENRLGAGGNLGTEAVAKAPPDGYTILLVLSGHSSPIRRCSQICRSSRRGTSSRFRC